MAGEGWDGAVFTLPGPDSARAAGAREDRSKGLQANTGLPEDLNSVENHWRILSFLEKVRVRRGGVGRRENGIKPGWRP